MRECPTCNYRNNPEHGSHCLACRIEFPRSNPYTPLPKPNQKLVVFDLDKTLYDLSRRERIAKRAGHKPGTTEWYASMNKPEHIPKDTVIPGTLEFARKLENDGFVIAYLTGRPDHLKASTRQKLKEDGFPIHRFKEDLLFLSPTVSSNLGTLATYKKGILTRLSNEFDLAFYFDDTREFREAAKSVHPRIPGIYSSIAQYTGEAPVKRNPELFTEKEEPEVVLVPIYSREPKGNFENLGMASAVVQVGRNFLKDIGEGLQDVYRAFVGGRQSMTEKRMAMAVMEMHKDLSRAAHNRGGNAICNLQLDYEYPSMDGRSGDLTLIATGDVIKMRSPPKTNPSLPSPRVGLPRKYMFQPARLKRIRQEAPSRYPGSTPHQAFYGAYDEAQDRPLFLPASHVWFEVNSVEERIQGYPTVDVYERVLRRLGQDREPAPFKTLTEEEGFYRLIGKLVPVKSNPPASELVMINPPPMPRKKRNKAGKMIKEPVEKYLQRFMGNPKMVEEFPDNAQRFVVGLSYARKFYGESTVNKHYPPIRTNPGVSVADAKKMYQQFHQKNPSKVEKKTMNIGETWIGLGKAWSIGYRSGKETGDENQKYIHNFGVDEESGKKFKEPELFYVPGEGGSEDLLIITGGDWYIDVDADGKVSWIYI